MKVGFFNERLLKQCSIFASAFAGFVSLVLAFFDISQEKRIIIGIIFVVILIIAYTIMLVLANAKNEQKLKINNTNVKIMYGDIFQQEGLKVIAFNEYFDTQVDDVIISRSSINGQFISKKVSNPEDIDKAVDNDIHLKSHIVEQYVDRPRGGKNTKYELGACCQYKDYIMLAFTHFDEENRAYFEVTDYVSCLMKMWNELDIVYAGRSVVLPLLGSGISRLKSEMSAQELLKELIWTYKASCIKFNNGTLTIVLPEWLKKETNLFDVGKE